MLRDQERFPFRWGFHPVPMKRPVPRLNNPFSDLPAQCAALDIPFADLTRPIAEEERQGRRRY